MQPAKANTEKTLKIVFGVVTLVILLLDVFGKKLIAPLVGDIAAVGILVTLSLFDVLAVALFLLAQEAAKKAAAKKKTVKKASSAPVKKTEPVKAVKEPAPAVKAVVKEVKEPALAEEGLSLKDALSLAMVNDGGAAVSKESVAAFLQENFGEDVVVNRRENYIKSGILPLADTHYKKIGAAQKCFAYVYELTGNHVFLLLRTNEQTAAEIKKKHPGFTRSAFPHSKAQDWYTLLLDESFADPKEVYETIAFVFENFGNAAFSPLKRINVQTAHTLFTDKEIESIVKKASDADVRFGKAGKESIVNVDTLSDTFDDGAEITLAALKEKALVSKSTGRIKVLARGELTKKFTVVADSYSADAAKMIVALGGSVIRLRDQK